MHSFIQLLGIVVCLWLAACNGQGTSKEPTQNPAKAPSTPVAEGRPTREIGKIVPAETIAGKSESYAYYLPKGYSHERPSPLVLFFDSHARGKDPVTRYQSLADQYHTILVGSNASRNGQLPLQSLQIYDALIQDVRTKFSVDEERITTCGFSGGARVAATIAQNRGPISNVISCAMVFEVQLNDPFNYYTIMGWEDFNFAEMQRVERFVDQTAQPHVVAYWEGGHEWPPVEVMRGAFDFVRFRKMNSGDVQKDSLVADAWKRFETEKQTLVPGSLAMWRVYKAFIAKLEGMTDFTKIIAEKAEMEKGSRWAKEMALEEQAIAAEENLRNQYVPLIGSKSVDEWRKMASQLRNAHGTNARELHLADLRVLNFLSLNTYFQVDGALKSGNLAATEHFLQIYALIDPSNPEHAYLTAVVRMRQGRPVDAIQSLQSALGLGFKDRYRLETDPEFAKLKTDPGFVKILDQLHAQE